jgi:hypothetical protein
MPVPSRRLKDLIEGTVDHHASQRWPTLEEVTIRWRGSYGYLTGYLSEDDDDTIELCRIQYLGNPDEWAFAIWQASTDSYAESVLLDGRPAGHPNLALDTACTLYLAGISDHPEQPDKPLKDLRGAALGTQAPGFGGCLRARPRHRARAPLDPRAGNAVTSTWRECRHYHLDTAPLNQLGPGNDAQRPGSSNPAAHRPRHPDRQCD